MAFKFTLKDGTEFEFPHFAECGSGAIRKTRKIEDDLDRAFTMIEIAVDEDGENPETLEALDKVPTGKLGEFIEIFMGGLNGKK